MTPYFTLTRKSQTAYVASGTWTLITTKYQTFPSISALKATSEKCHTISACPLIRLLQITSLDGTEVCWLLQKICLAEVPFRQSNKPVTMDTTTVNLVKMPQIHPVNKNSSKIREKSKALVRVLWDWGQELLLPVVCRSSSHKLMWGNCSICFHFLLFPFLFPPPPAKQTSLV